ncbi:exo-alpha-sialidase [Candidatus Uhrbacteria bacterium]|nr:exo-alpha-sialidase [Candidatus Uhrbacteria bacterium]
MKFSILIFLLILSGFGCVSQDLQTGNEEVFVSEKNPQENQPIANLYYDHVFFATSSDGIAWSLGEEAIAEHASVPDLLVLDKPITDYPAQTIMSYFVDASPKKEGEDERVAFITSDNNGETWSDRVIVELDREDLLPVDPSVIQLEDGSLRLYFFDWNAGRARGQKKPNIIYTFYSALSTDGIHFTVEDASLLSDTLMTDPEVVLFEGSWIMYFARHEGDDRGIWVATSDDGIHFADERKVDIFQGIPGAMVHNDEVYLYGCDQGGIPFATSTNAFDFLSQNNSKPVLTVNGLLCDPSPAILPNGEFGLVLKRHIED